mmetsp:Transcript_11749/g.23918  ORF Transcript_11749/g.23918 Transcript_11749/m.23918 type:complete len:125 (-) Transcript_11749:146-520(-)
MKEKIEAKVKTVNFPQAQLAVLHSLERMESTAVMTVCTGAKKVSIVAKQANTRVRKESNVVRSASTAARLESTVEKKASTVAKKANTAVRRASTAARKASTVRSPVLNPQLETWVKNSGCWASR